MRTIQTQTCTVIVPDRQDIARLQAMPARKRMMEILKDTAAYYNADPGRRATSTTGGCVWQLEDGRRCAVGRFIDEKKIHLLGGRTNAGFTGSYQKLGDHLGVSNMFWGDLQTLHDFRTYWGSDGITTRGQKKVDSIAEKIEAGHYDI